MKLLDNARGNIAEGFCLVKSCDARTSKNGKVYLDLTLSDNGGDVSAKFWDYIPETHSVFEPGSVIKVRGVITEWQGSPQLKVERIRRRTDEDEVDMSELVAAAPVSPDGMYGSILTFAKSFRNAELSKIVVYLLEKNREALLVAPAAMRMHHAYMGGILYHTSAILSAAKGVCAAYPFLDCELVYAGVILHDLAKTKELEYSEVGVPSGYTVWGNLIGHLVGGAIEIEKAADICGTSAELRIKLQHIILSHHGVPEFGSPVAPMFPEAEVVSSLDDLDATLFQMLKAMSETNPGEMTQRVFGLDRKLYNHGKDGEYLPKI